MTTTRFFARSGHSDTGFFRSSSPAPKSSFAQGRQPVTHETLLAHAEGWRTDPKSGRQMGGISGGFSLLTMRKDQSSDLWVVPADGSAPPRATYLDKGLPKSGVAWSADSRRIAFATRRESDEVAQIYVLDLVRGGEAMRVTSLSDGRKRHRSGGRMATPCCSRGLVYPGAADDAANRREAAARKDREVQRPNI